LPALAADLVGHQAVVIVADRRWMRPAKLGLALPFVFVIGGDPVALGLVASLNRPGGNLTGVTFFANSLGSKRLGGDSWNRSGADMRRRDFIALVSGGLAALPLGALARQNVAHGISRTWTLAIL
jgi:hypothetical protein